MSGSGEPLRKRDECIYVEGYGFADPASGRGRNTIRIYANAIGYALLLFLALQSLSFIPYAIASMVRLAVPSVRIYQGSILAPREAVEIINLASALIYFIIPILLLRAVLGGPPRQAAGVKKNRAVTAFLCVGIVLGSSAIGSNISLLLSGLLEKVGLYPEGPAPAPADSPLVLLLLALNLAVIPALMEELLFRGIILQSLRRFGDLFSLTVTTLLFALMHRNLAQLPNALITGLVLGFLMLRTGSLAIVTLCHFINNVIPVLLGVVPEENLAWSYLLINGIYLFLGLASLMAAGVMGKGLFAPLRGEGRASEGYKYKSFFSSVPILFLLLLLGILIGLNMAAS